jgi:hypothetical protein
MNLYYKLKTGLWTRRYNLESAFEICTGKRYYGNEREFLRWLHSLLGKSIIAAKRSDDPTLVDELLANGQNVLACAAYRDCRGCTLTEAKKAIENRKE